MIVMKRESLSSETKKTGRPRDFDANEALEHAMHVFWKHGYESTSMTVLSQSMRMNAPSIYAAFGDKKSLFLKALDLYVGDLDEIRKTIDDSTSAYDAARGMLLASAIRFTGTETPRGGMLASATASGSAECADVQVIAAKKRASIESSLRARIERDIENGSLPKSTSASALAALTISVIQGLSVLARDGSSRKKLQLVADAAMAAWKTESEGMMAL